MITEQELKDRCTPEFIKWMCELAEGFEFDYSDKRFIYINGRGYALFNEDVFPLLIHRAVDGYNSNDENFTVIEYHIHLVRAIKNYRFRNYQPQSLTQSECAMLHCLLDILAEAEK